MYVCASCSNKTSETADFGNHISQLPQLRITADSSLIDTIYQVNRRKIPAYAVFVTAEGDTLYDDSLKYIRTRGNQTYQWTDKKSFTIKFRKGTKIPQLEKNKNFILLANSFDDSYIRNAIAYDLAKELGIIAPNYTYIQLFINDSYKGLYQMTNKIEVSKRIIDIVNLEKENRKLNKLPLESYPHYIKSDNKEIVSQKGFMLPNVPSNITGGYLLLYDWEGAYSRAESGFVSEGGDEICVKSPKHCSIEEIQYIQKCYSMMELAIRDTTNADYLDYIDVESFAKYYLLQELFLNIDGGIGSMYLYKDANSKFYAGPLWDMDATLNNASLELKYTHPNMRILQAPWENVTGKKTEGIYYLLCQRKDFEDTCRHYYNSHIKNIMHSYIKKGKIDYLIKILANEVEVDNCANGTRHHKSYEDAVATTIQFFNKRVQFFDWYYSTSRDSMICLTDITESTMIPHDRRFKIYYPKGTPITCPDKAVKAIRTPTPQWYIAGTDTVLTEGMCLYKDYDIECRLVPPSWLERQKRRIKKYTQGRLYY